LHPRGEDPSCSPSARGAERLARRAVGFALDADVSVDDAARLLVVDAQHDRLVLEAARIRILRAANGPASQRAARSVWMAVQLLDADDDRQHTFDTPRIVLVGMPGAGKGTQGQRLSRALDVPHVAMGALVREVAREETPFGFQAQLFMERGDLVPDSLVLEILARRFAADDVRAGGFVLDGFPRTIEQAVALDALLGAPPVDIVLELVVRTDTAQERLRSRGRLDDVDRAVTRRIDDFVQRTTPLLAWYGERAEVEVWTIDGERTEDDVSRELLERIRAWDDSRRRRP
jgi:adenylate kinase